MPLIALAIDAADGRLVHRLAADGHLPTIARLIERGRQGAVRSPADVGSGAVWPTFSTGEPPERHGVFGEHAWDADTMRLRRPTFDHIDPFWRGLADAGRRVAVVDVPFAPAVGHERLVEIADWGAHDWFGGAPVVRPRDVETRLHDLLEPRHPLVAGRVDSAGPGDVEGLREVIQLLTRGVRQRGALACRLLETVPLDLLLVVFTEAHRASHLLWHTLDADHPVWREGIDALPPDVMRGLLDIFREIDAQLATMLDRAGPEAPVVVFALHGMQPARGIPAFLNDVLERWGVARRRQWWQQSSRELAGAALKGLKARLPASVKTAYYRRVPKSVTMQLAQPSMPVPPWDWARTVAFALPTDQHGWIRLNLVGREAEGIVALSDYDVVCEELRTRLLALATAEGPLVRDVVRTADASGLAPRNLPDLVVHWTSRTWRPQLRLLDPPLHATAIGQKFVGQHDDAGFYVAAGAGMETWPDLEDASTLGARLAAAVECRQRAT